jgi:acetyl esterase/lipase
VERAGAWLVRWAEERGAEVWLAGHSAGSHLAAMLVSSAWYSALAPAAARRLAGVVHLSGVFCLEPLLRTSVSIPGLGLGRAVAWASPASGDNVARLAGAGRHLITMLVVGQHDSPAFKEQVDLLLIVSGALQAEEYGQLLEGAGLRVVRREQPGEDHFRWGLRTPLTVASLVERLADRQYGLTSDILRLLAGAYSV